MVGLLTFSKSTKVSQDFYQQDVKAYPHDTIVIYDSSLRRMRLCHIEKYESDASK